MQTLNVLDHIFANMPHSGKWQRRFLRLLFATLFALQGRVSFTNLARYSTACEQTFRRHFAKDLDWLWFNSALIELVVEPEQTVIGVFDCSFIEKSGTKTYGLDRFWSSSDKAARRGLEISHVGCICVETEQAWTLDVTQTPPGLSTAKETDQRTSGYTRVNLARIEMVSLGISFNSYVRRAYNRFLVGILLEQLGLEAEYGLKDPVIETVVNTGRMAA